MGEPQHFRFGQLSIRLQRDCCRVLSMKCLRYQHGKADDAALRRWPRLLAKTQRRNDTEVALNVRLLEVVQQPPTLAHELEQPATGVMILLMRLKMLGQVRDPLTEKGNLDLGRSSVRCVQAVLVNDALFCADR